MSISYDLTKLDEASFEHLTNALALRVLGSGHTGFGPGSDGGRDGYFEGTAPYPSTSDQWSGRWYLQAKYHRPHLSKDAQKWLLSQIQDEINAFQKSDTKRIWPNNWIVVTNIDPSGKPETGAFDKANRMVTKAHPPLAGHFHIWGGTKILQLLTLYPDIAEYYAHFLTPGQVLTSLYHQLNDTQASIRSIIRYFVVTQFNEQQHTKLEQAGSAADSRPGIHRLFTDLPFVCKRELLGGLSAEYLARTAARNHRIDQSTSGDKAWESWQRHPSRARIWFIKGGPGQGKSTLTQYLAQIQRAALMLGADAPTATAQQRETAKEVRGVAQNSSFWPIAPRIPVYIELKDFAKWYGEKADVQAKGVLTFLAERLSQQVEQPTHTGTLKRAFSQARWLIVFDGLDEVPSDVKSNVASEVITFVDDGLVALSADALIICTSRPQGYSGQFASFNAAEIELLTLKPEQALNCAIPVLKFDRSDAESKYSVQTLKEALQSPSVREIMTTPLQSHIMAIVVRDGGRPPDRKWRLFANFYQVIKKREANRNLADKRLSKLLHSGDKLIKALHNRLGFELHARAEQSKGAQTSLARDELAKIVLQIVSDLQSTNIDETVSTLMEATTTRLVLVNTPESGDYVRFDIRPLQEFFAAEYMYEDISAEDLGDRVSIVSGDSHWREVMHFLLSALVENSRRTDLAVAVDRLANLDDRPDGSPARQFYRRLAAGAVIAARLFIEGVLDQDQRVRQQFKRCIEPLFGSLEVELLSEFGSVRGSDVASWLIDVLVDTLAEQSESESIGAAYVLCILTPDGHVRQNEIQTLLKARSAEYKSCLFALLGSREIWNPDSSQKRFDSWVARFALEILAGSDWSRLGERGIRSAFGVVLQYSNRLPEVARAAGLDPTFADFLRPLLLTSDPAARASKKASHVENLNGIIEMRFFAPDRRLDPSKWSGDLRRSIVEAPGIFALVQHSFAFVQGHPSQESLAVLTAASAFINALPEPWREFLPLELFASNVRMLKQPEQIAETFSWQYKPGYECETRFLGITKNLDFEAFLNRHPTWAVRLCAVTFDTGDDDAINRLLSSTPAIASAIVAQCIKDPKIISWSPEAWGLLIQRCGPGTSIREAVLAAASEWKPGHRFGDVHAFALNLPIEASLLPPIIYVLSDTRNRLGFTNRKSIPVSALAKMYVPSVSDLFPVFTNTANRRDVRGAAAMMCLLHPDCPQEQVYQCMQALARHYEPNANSWYLAGAATALTSFIAAGDDTAIETMGGLLRAGSIDFIGKLSLADSFERWRERSSAPVTRHGIASF
jgi:hypothetical protein